MKQESEHTGIPSCTVSPGQIVFYSLSTKQNKRQGKDENSLTNLQYNYKCQDITQTASKQLLKTAKALISSTINQQKSTPQQLKKISYRPVFITLTLPARQQHSSYYINHHLLRNFLKRLQYKFRSASYLWKAELQKNGNIHYHILFDRFISWKWIRRNWNEILSKHGYIDEFEKKHNHRDPNSADIASLKNYKKAGYYLAKYIKKQDHKHKLHKPSNSQNQILQFSALTPAQVSNSLTYNHTGNLPGRKWGCSKNYKNYKNFRTDEFDFPVTNLFGECLHYSTKHIEHDYIDVFYFDDDVNLDGLRQEIFKAQRQHDLLYFKHNPPPEP